MANNDGDNYSANVAKKMNMRPFKNYGIYLDPLYFSNEGHFSWSWIPIKDFILVQNKKQIFINS